MKNNVKILFVILLFYSTIAKSQDTVYMPYFQLDRIYWEYQVIAAKKFSTFLNDSNRYELILPELKGTTYPDEPFTQTIANAKAADAKYFIIGKMKALNEAMLVSMTLYNTSDSLLLWSDSLLTRTSYDLDSVLKLFADNIGTVNKASQRDTIYSITHFNPDELIKVDATWSSGFSLSMAYTPIDRGNNLVSPGLGIFASYDSKKIILDFVLDYHPGMYHRGVLQLFDIKVSGLYPLKTTKTTPFIGGSIAFSTVRLTYPNPNPRAYDPYARADGMGMAIFLNAGYLIKRDLKRNFRLTGSLFIPFFVTESYPHTGTRWPFCLIMNAAVLL